MHHQMYAGGIGILALVAPISHAGGGFTTVISIGTGQPDGLSLGNSFEIFTDDFQVNLFPGGSIGESFDFRSDPPNAAMVAFTNAEFNMSGGMLGRGATFGDGVVVNISGGSAEDSMAVSEPAVLNFSGGYIGDRLDLRQTFDTGGAALNMTGGRLGDDLSLRSGAAARIAGGVVGRDIFARSGSSIELVGNGFTLNGAPVVGPVTLDFRATTFGFRDVVAGVLEDGTPIVFSDLAQDEIPELTFIVATPAPIAFTNLTLDDAMDVAPTGLRSGQLLTVRGDGAVDDDFVAIGGTLIVEGGNVGSNAELVGTSVQISGGTVLGGLHAFQGTDITMTDGTLGHQFGEDLALRSGSSIDVQGGQLVVDFTATDTSDVTVSDGTIGGNLFLAYGGHLNVSGGDFISASIGLIDATFAISGGFFRDAVAIQTDASGTITGGDFSDLDLGSGSDVMISGGLLNRRFDFDSDAILTLMGNEFMLNGMPITDLTGGVRGDVFTCTLADGTVFVWPFNETIAPGAITLVPVLIAPADTMPMTVSAGPALRSGLRAGQSLTALSGSTIGDGFGIADATLVIDGGAVGRDLTVVRSSILLESGTIDSGLDVLLGSDVVMNGGSLGGFVNLSTGSTLTLNDGLIDGTVRPTSGSTLIVNGGELNDNFSSFVVNGGDASFEFNGGTVGGVTLASSLIDITGDALLGLCFFRNGSDVLMTGGTIGTGSLLLSSDLTIQNGMIGARFEVDGGHFEMLGGTLGNEFYAESGASVRIAGGRLGDGFLVDTDAFATFVGGEFTLNGAPISQLTNGLGPGDLFACTLADGTPIILSGDDSYGPGQREHLPPGATTLEAAPLDPVDITPILLSAGPAPVPGLRAGQSLTLSNTGEIGNNFAIIDATLQIDGGVIGDDLEIARSTVTMTGGTVGREMETFNGSVVTVQGGDIGSINTHAGSSLRIEGGSHGSISPLGASAVEIAGGTTGAVFAYYTGSSVDVTGGTIDFAHVGSSNGFEFSGGDIAYRLQLYFGASANINATRLWIDGTEIPLTPGIPFEIEHRDGLVFEALLLDGSTIDFVIANSSSEGSRVLTIAQSAILTITNPLPANGCSADFDDDGDVDLGDFGIFGAAFNSMVGDMNYNPAADNDNDDDVDLGDFGVFGAQFGRTDCIQ